ncbi:hypothetical protein GW755_00860 [bacterium]|nr:hypothetical protein [bacterium]
METGIDKEQIVKAKYQVKEYAQLILSFLVFVGAILLFVFVIKPTFAKYQNNKLEITNQLSQEMLLDKKLAELQKAKELQSSIESNILLANQAVPDDSDIPTVMAMIQDVSSKSGVKVSAFSYIGLGNSVVVVETPTPAVPQDGSSGESPVNNGLESPVDSEYFDAFNLSISVLGKFDNLKDFTKKIESSRRVLDMSGFSYSIEKENEQITSDFYTLKVQLTSYYRSFANVAPLVALDQYSGTISDLNEMVYYEVDLSNTTIGRDDPFKTNNANPSSGSTSGSTFFGGSGSGGTTTNSSAPNQENPGVNVVEPVPDQGAQTVDVQQMLKDMVAKEGL